MPQSFPDGSVSYGGQDQLTDVQLNGVSVMNRVVREVKYWADGWGYVVTEQLLDGTGAKTTVDNQARRYTFYGWISVTP